MANKMFTEMLLKQNLLDKAIETFEQMINQYETNKFNSIIVYNTLESIIKHFLQSQKADTAIFKRLIMTIGKMKVKPNSIFFNKILGIASKSQHNQIVIEIFTIYMKELDAQPSLVTYNTMLDFYFKNNMSD